jgi:hypothetical protein
MLPLNSPNREAKAVDNNWSLSGAIWDPHGYAGPKNNWWVYDMPFLTQGAECTDVAPAGKNGKSCNGEYYEVLAVPNTDPKWTATNIPGMTTVAYDVKRHDCSGAGTVGNQGNPADGCRWTIGDGSTSHAFGWMHHFAARTGGQYSLRFPSTPEFPYTLPTEVMTNISNAWRATDQFILGIEFNGRGTATGELSLPSGAWWLGPTKRPLKHTDSYDKVVNAPDADLMWQDRTNNMVWVKIKGGFQLPTDATTSTDTSLHSRGHIIRNLYHTMRLDLKTQQ